MIKFRLHRGTLEESMKTYRTFETIDEMKLFLYNHLKDFYESINAPFPYKVSDIFISDSNYGDDTRIGWKNVHVVCCTPGNGCAWIGE